MSVQTIDAVYEHGAFRPVVPVASGFSEGQRVRLVVEPLAEASDYLRLMTGVFSGLAEVDVDAIEAAAQRRNDFFGGDSN